MSEKIWIGAIYLKDEGGYDIILKSLRHYKNRLKTISDSPELKDSAAMFGGILKQAAIKTIPKIDEITQKIQNDLPEIQLLDTLKENIPCSIERSVTVLALPQASKPNSFLLIFVCLINVIILL